MTSGYYIEVTGGIDESTPFTVETYGLHENESYTYDSKFTAMQKAYELGREYGLHVYDNTWESIVARKLAADRAHSGESKQ